ncbi:MAG: amino acid-binding protein [Propioniciclava sp.]
MILMRLQLPDRPGSLGLVTSALGDVAADISAIEIVERHDGYAVDDFILDLPEGTPPDRLISACTALTGVEVMWVSNYPVHWGLVADTDAVDAMTEDPDRAEQTLMELAPAVFHCTWALIVDSAGQVQSVTHLGPQDLRADADRFGDLSTPHCLGLTAGWAAGWGEHAAAAAPFRTGERAIVIARPGPEFQRSELVRLRHLALLADQRVH